MKIDIKIVKDSGVPLYMQVKKQIMDMIKSGDLKVGTKIPTERVLSEQLEVSRNTISTAYKELEQDGVLKSYQGRGTFVAEEANPWKAQNIKEKIIKFVDLGLEEALEAGMDAEEFIEIVLHRVKEKKDMMSKMTAVYVECNEEQSKMFSKQLSTRTNMNVIPLTIKDIKEMSGETETILEKSQVIIATFNHVNEIVNLTKRYDKDIIGVAINPDLETIVKIARFPLETAFGFICMSKEFMFKARGALEKAGLGGIDIEYSNSTDKNELKRLVSNSDVIIVSPGRYKEVREIAGEEKDIIQFLYGLDDGSVKALKSKIVELKGNS